MIITLSLTQDDDTYIPDGTEMDYSAQAGANGIVISGDAPPGAHHPEIQNTERVTTPYMTKYEKARILGTRALQIRYVPCFFLWERANE